MLSVIEKLHSECFWKCVHDCRCLSFSVCDKQCQLHADTKDMRPNSIMKLKYGCIYYDLKASQTTGHPVCCSMTNPCLNGGSCSAATQNSKRRFRCRCKNGFYGELCQTYKPRSCASFLPQKVKPLSGEYTILDASGTPYLVYCDFDSEPGFAWTMLVSFSRSNGATPSGKGLLEDLPINENTPNWENYRLSLARMNALREHSSHWRATCGYDTHGVDYQDYIRVNLSEVDFAAYYFNGVGSSACTTIEYMNILGSQCNNCNFALYSYASHIPALFLSYSKTWSHCTFDLSKKNHLCAGGHDAALFIIDRCLNTRFRCHKTLNSTTQNWFGNAPKN